VRNFL